MAAKENLSTEEKVLGKVAQALKDLHYGAVQITVHNSRVTQIDRLERVRLLRDE
ncbi:MAG: YezD family protein [Candidatus Margulisbacteria bacterium]|jgi:hypothetical protein|nr:YezD family protein [Candidatus Margulisiibacteriota bacterium]